jgi:hypothetical protein
MAKRAKASAHSSAAPKTKPVTARELAKLLTHLNACPEGMSATKGQSLRVVWNTCSRGDWLLWLAARLEIDRKTLVGACADVAETALRFVPNTEPRPAACISAIRKWLRDEITDSELRAAAWAADAARAAYAAYAAAGAAAWAADAAYAAHAAGAAAGAAAWAAGAAAGAASRLEFARIVRKAIPLNLIVSAARFAIGKIQ